MTKPGSCCAINALNCFRLSFLRYCTSPAREATWTWKTFFARSTPIIIFCILPSSSSCGVTPHNLGTLRCRLGRAATIPSRRVAWPVRGIKDSVTVLAEMGNRVASRPVDDRCDEVLQALVDRLIHEFEAGRRNGDEVLCGPGRLVEGDVDLRGGRDPSGCEGRQGRVRA